MATENKNMVSAEEYMNIEKILKQRAELLSEKMEYEDNNISTIDIVEFQLNSEIYAFEAKYIRQVAKIKDFSLIPHTPEYVLGVTAMHEQIISIIDIRIFFEMNINGISNLNKIVILEDKALSFAIATDEIIGIKTIPRSSLQQQIDTFDDIRKKYFLALTSTQTIILDAKKLLSDSDIILN